MAQKVVLCGAGFLGMPFVESIRVAFSSRPTLFRFEHRNCDRQCKRSAFLRRVHISSKYPHNAYAKLKETMPEDHLLPPVPVDVTMRESLAQAFKNADAVVSLVDIHHGSPAQFEPVQRKGAENVARAAAAISAKLVHISAIGADLHGKIPYTRTRTLGEEAVRSHCTNTTIVRPSLVFGPGDGLFNVKLSGTWLNCLDLAPDRFPDASCFGKDDTRFQAVYHRSRGTRRQVYSRSTLIDSHTISLDVTPNNATCGGHTGRFRPTIFMPSILGELQGEFMQRLPKKSIHHRT